MTVFLGSDRSFHGEDGRGFDFSGFLRSDFGFLKRGGRLKLMAPEENDPGFKDETDGDWLRLSIAGSSRVRQPPPDRRNYGSNLVELDLMPSSSCNNNYQIRSSDLSPEISLPPPPPPSSNPSSSLQDASNLGFTPFLSINLTPNNSSSPTPVLHSRRPYAGVDFRVVQPPRRPHSGIWFMLLASENQEKEPSALPQIPKRFLRIKDGRMRIGVVLKYLGMKLKLGSESEIEISCRGRKVDPSLTIQYVRDSIWSNSPRDFITLLPNSSAINHIMHKAV